MTDQPPSVPEANTRASYRQTCRHINAGIGGVKVQALKPAQVKDLYTELGTKTVQRGRNGKPEKLSNRTRRYCAMILKSALEEAVELQMIRHNPANGVRLSMPRVETKADAWSIAEVEAFLKAASGELTFARTGGKAAKDRKPEIKTVPPGEAKPSPYLPIFHLMRTLGLRRSEALGLA